MERTGGYRLASLLLVVALSGIAFAESAATPALTLGGAVPSAIKSANIKIYPPTDQAIGAVTSTTVGRWIVFKATPFGIVPSQPITLGGDPGCLWTGVAGTYTAVLIPTDQSMPLEMGSVTLGGKVKPDPDPDPKPKPGHRTVVVVAEEDNQTAYREVAIQALRDWVIDSKHDWDGLYDPDQASAAAYLDDAKRAGLPAILVIAEVDGQDVVVAKPFPASGKTAASGLAAGEAAIAIVKEAGG